MRARLAFGACLAIDFDIYLIDEVTETGDERFRRKCALAFRERIQRSDIILVTHNSRTIRQYCADGELRLYDDVAGALADYRRLGETVQ
jgi:capsular polysaccharide transport system ATP-binding protein